MTSDHGGGDDDGHSLSTARKSGVAFTGKIISLLRLHLVASG